VERRQLGRGGEEVLSAVKTNGNWTRGPLVAGRLSLRGASRRDNACRAEGNETACGWSGQRYVRAV